MVAKYVAGLTMNQMARAYKAVKSQKKPKNILAFKMPKKKGWKKPFFPKSKMMPEYSPYDLATELAGAGLVVGGYAGYKKLTNGKKKKGT